MEAQTRNPALVGAGEKGNPFSAKSTMKKPIIIGVAGGTASGKTTVAKRILETIGSDHLAYIQHDAYYRDLSHLPLARRREFNFDHPDSLENKLLIAHLELLLQGQPVQIPVYDFAKYVRTDQLRPVESRQVILVEGILIFADKKLRDMMDIKIYVDAPPDLRFIRRLRRDVVERNRSVNHVVEQYLETVRPMHLEFVEPSKRYADVIIPRGGRNIKAIQMVIAQIQRMLEPDSVEWASVD
jgi:uridine kinase